MKNHLTVKLYPGIGNYLKYKTIFNELLSLGKFDEIRCSVSRAVVEDSRGSYEDIEAWYQSHYDVLNFLFSKDKNITVVDNQEFELRHPRDFALPIVPKIQKDIIKEFSGFLDLPDEYVTITPKVWSDTFHYDHYESLKKDFFKALKSLESKIVIIGERNITPSREYSVVPCFSIYEDIVSEFPDHIDMTTPETKNNNDIPELKRSFYIMNNAKLNILLTHSGAKVLMPFVSDNILGLYHGNHWDNWNPGELDARPNINYVSSFQILIDHIRTSYENNIA
jgi:hypothetical protein